MAKAASRFMSVLLWKRFVGVSPEVPPRGLYLGRLSNTLFATGTAKKAFGQPA